MMMFDMTRKIFSARAIALALLALLAPQMAAAKDVPANGKPNQYCESIADAAADARFELQKQALAKMEQEIEARVKVLEAKRAEYEEWLKRRNEVLEKADETVVSIYSKMRPDASALQLANMDGQIAAAIIAKLNPRAAGAVLNEMEPARAAQIANILTDAPKRAEDTARQ